MEIIIGISVVIVIFLIITYNSLIRLKLRTENALAGIDNQLKRRYDLIPNLVNIVKGYMKHEKETLESVINARNGLVSDDIGEKSTAALKTTKAVNKLFALAESYPDLKANTNFKELQIELIGTEDKIAYARQYYNQSVMLFNNKVLSFPSNLIANAFKFKQKLFFEVTEKEKELVEINL